METLKQWIALSVLAALAVVAGGWFLVISPKRSEAAEVRTQVAGQLSSNDVLATQIEVLKAKSRDLPAEQARLARVAAKIPENPGLPNYVRSLLDASAATGVELVSITPGQPVLAAAPAAAAPADPNAPAPAAAPAAPAAGAAGQLATIPVSINVVGGFFEVTQFMVQLEQLPRAMRVNNLTMTPGTAPTGGTVDAAELASGDSLTSTISGTIYMRAGGAAAGPGATPSTAAPAAAAPAAAASNS